MPNLSLSIASNNIKICACSQPLLSLDIRRKLIYRLSKHGGVKTNLRLALMAEHPMELSMWSHLKVELSINLPQSIELLHPVLLNFFWCPLIVFMRVGQNRITCNISISPLSHFSDVWITVVDIIKLLLVEVALCSLFNKLRGYNFVFDASLHSVCHWSIFDCFSNFMIKNSLKSRYWIKIWEYLYVCKKRILNRKVW